MVELPLVSDPVCREGDAICQQVLDWTGNAGAARFADLAIGTPLTLLLLIVLGLAVRWVLHRLVDRLVARAEEGVLPDRVVRGPLGQVRADARPGDPVHEAEVRTRRVQRAQTMGSLLKSIVSGVVLAVIATMMLSEVGVNVGPIVASAGIIGIALGFGSQTLVKDFLSGIFMIFEDQYGVGDVVDVGAASGTVEAVSLRVTRLRDVNGTVWYVRNGEILRVGNMSQNWARSMLDLTVAHDADLGRVRRVLQDVARDVWNDDDFRGRIIEEPEVWGVESISPDGVTVRLALKTPPLEQGAVAREVRARVLARFAHEGITMPSRQPGFVGGPTPPTADPA